MTLLRPYRGVLAAIAVCLVVEMTFYVSLPVSVQVLVDQALLPHDGSVLVKVLVFLVSMVTLAVVAGLCHDRLAARVVAGVVRDLRAMMFEQLQRLSLSYFQKTSEGDIVARFAGDLQIIEDLCASIIPWVLLPGLSVVASTVMLFLLDWKLALVSMVIWPVCLLGPRWTTPRAIAASYEKRDGEAVTASRVQETVAAQPVIKIFNLADHSTAAFDRQNEELSSLTRQVHYLTSTVERSSTIGNLALQVLILGFGATLTYHGEMSIGSLTAFQSLFLLLSEQVTYLMQFTPTMIRAAGSVRRISNLLHAVPEIFDRLGAIQPVPFEREIALDHVSFGYDDENQNLRDVSLSIRKGQSVALVGPSGCGKSTVLKLILRLYDPQQGAVRVDGQDLRDVQQAAWRSHIGTVLQESFLFDTTILENIRMGRLHATDAEVEQAAREADIHEFICQLPRGYKTRVGARGGQLSGGQRQRIAIARAILRNPSILVLDEATSALDATSEAAINATLARLGHGRTVITVTHRLAAASSADRLFVFRSGQLVEQGSHPDLLTQGGVYAELWSKQSGFQVEDDDHVAVSLDRLRLIPLLARLDDAALETLRSSFDRSHFGEQRIVVREGEPGDKFYFVVRGKLEAVRDTEYGYEQRLTTMVDGDFFGEIALLRNVPRTATVRTLTETLLISLSRKKFLETFANDPQVRDELERTVALRR